MCTYLYIGGEATDVVMRVDSTDVVMRVDSTDVVMRVDFSKASSWLQSLRDRLTSWRFKRCRSLYIPFPRSRTWACQPHTLQRSG